MRHSEYTSFFRKLAEEHADIRHNKEECRFLRLILSSDPLQRIMDAREFYDSLRRRLARGYAMILISYEADYTDTGGDRKEKEYHGSFIYGKIKEKRLQTINDMINLCRTAINIKSP